MVGREIFPEGQKFFPEMVEFSNSFFIQPGKLSDVRPGSEAAALTGKDKRSYFRIGLVDLSPFSRSCRTALLIALRAAVRFNEL